MTSARQTVQRMIAGRCTPALERATAYAPANIALVKYWGKRDETLNLPVTGSLSISLGSLGSHVELSQVAGADRIWLNKKPLPAESSFVQRASAYFDLFRHSDDFFFDLKARNTVPTAAGFASSASGFAALAKALDVFFGWDLSIRELSILARLGSGSASRSLEDGFVEWQAGTAADGMDSFASRMDADWPDLRVGAVVLCSDEKPVGSREGMRRSVETCEFYREWPGRVAADMVSLKQAIVEKDFTALGTVAEANALAMHALMMATRPAIVYALPETVAAMRTIWAARAEGLALWFTMDAGPNVKLLFEAQDEARVRELFPAVEIVTPFA